mgnify:CR=1 FL=1
MPNNIQLIATGSFGCVYRPGFNKKGTPLKKYVTKISSQLNESLTEYRIGKKLSKVANYEKRFGIVESIRKLNMSTLSSKNKEDCKFISQNTGSRRFYALNSKYIDFIKFPEFFRNMKNTYYYITFFEYILQSIYILINHKIVHYDLHMGNLFLNIKTHNPMIIDFGLSFIMNDFVKNKKINYSILKQKFYIYDPSWHNWSLEIHFINWFCQFTHNTHLTSQYIHEVIDIFIMQNPIFSVFSHTFKEHYRSKALEFYLPFANKRRQYVILSLLKHWKTWDIYTISIAFLGLMKSCVRLNQSQIVFLEILILNIHPIPHKRPNVQENQTFLETLKLKKIDNAKGIYFMNNTPNNHLNHSAATKKLLAII